MCKVRHVYLKSSDIRYYNYGMLIIFIIRPYIYLILKKIIFPDSGLLQTLLCLPDDAWLQLTQEARSTGESLYLRKKSKRSADMSSSTTQRAFATWCDTFSEQTYRPFQCVCRPFRKGRDGALLGEEAGIRMMALEVEKM